MSSYREIVTKTVIGKGKKSFVDHGRIKANNTPSTILGCWIINNDFNGVKNNGSVIINGTYDLNVWYSYDNNSKTDVIKQTIPYNETVHIKNTSDVSNQEVIVRSLKQPTISKVDIDGDDIVYVIDKELGIELVGDEKVKIAVDDEEDPWDEIIDDVNDKQIDNEVNEEFIKEDQNEESL
ncbi:MAG: outer spore coat protein CotE [Bacilli bacterium]|nr:outer spore coat protein CotE [Bacilli bacterium]